MWGLLSEVIVTSPYICTRFHENQRNLQIIIFVCSQIAICLPYGHWYIKWVWMRSEWFRPIVSYRSVVSRWLIFFLSLSKHKHRWWQFDLLQQLEMNRASLLFIFASSQLVKLSPKSNNRKRLLLVPIIEFAPDWAELFLQL